MFCTSRRFGVPMVASGTRMGMRYSVQVLVSPSLFVNVAPVRT